MLDTKKVGIKIAALRKGTGYSQERLADLIGISPQAISKWENGHTLPETSLLPVLAQIFNTTIDEIIMPAYLFDEKIEQEKSNIVEQQAEHIAKYLIQKLEGVNPAKEIIGLTDDTIINSVYKTHPNIGNCTVSRGNPVRSDRFTSINIIISAPQKELMLIERIYSHDDNEIYRYDLIKQYTLAIPQVYHIDFENKIILMEDLNNNYIQGFHFNDNNEYGVVIRDNYNALLHAAASFHSAFWENYNVFDKIGLDWRLEAKENLLAHINGMEKDYKKYRKNEENGKVPKVWEIFENKIELEKLDYYQNAIDILREEYIKLIDERFHCGKNITVIHGDLHPGNMYVSGSADRTVKLIDLQAVRIGLCTEDLAMLLALHIEPDKKYAMHLLDHYYHCLCKNIKDYPYDIFISDYKISIMESMFFNIRLMNRGIYDFSMRDKAIKAFETFILDK